MADASEGSSATHVRVDHSFEINTMTKDVVTRQLRVFKDRGVKVTTSGSLAKLKQRLNDVRNERPDIYAEMQPAASPARSDDEPAQDPAELCKIGDICLNLKEMHPITLSCFQKLQESTGLRRDVKKTTIKDQQKLNMLVTDLRPVEKLVQAVIRAKETVDEDLKSSPSVNFELLNRTVRNIIPSISVSPAVATLFKAFGVMVVDIVPGAAQPLPSIEDLDIRQGSAKDSFEPVMRKRFQEEMRENTRRSQSLLDDNASHAPSHSYVSSVRRGKTVGTDSDEVLLDRQLAAVQHALRFMLRDWRATFPAPKERKWPADFSHDEVTSVCALVRSWIKEPKNKVDILLAEQPEKVINSAVQDLLADRDFPVPDAQKDQTLKGVFRDTYKKIYKSNYKFAYQKRERARADGNGSDQGQVQSIVKYFIKAKAPAHQDDGEAGKPDVAGSKRSRPVVISSDEEGSADRKPPAAKKTMTSPDARSRLVPEVMECMKCFFDGKECSLKLRTDETNVAACEACDFGSETCRVLCLECTAIAEDAGRGSGPGGEAFLISNCELGCIYLEADNPEDMDEDEPMIDA